MKKILGKLVIGMALVGTVGAFQLTTTGCSKDKQACIKYEQQMCKDPKAPQCKFVKAKIQELGGEQADKAIDFCSRNLKK